MKFCYDNEADIPEALRTYYKKAGDGKWYLECEGAVAKSRLDEFRTNNTTLQTKITELEVKFKDIDPTEYTRLKTIETDLENGKLSDKTKDVLEKRTAEMKKAHDAEVLKLAGERDGARKELEGLKIGDSAVAKAVTLGMQPGAKDDLVTRVRAQFKLNDKGEVRAYNAQGAEIYGATGAPMTIDEYVEGLTKNAPHLFKPSDGTGASGGDGNRGGGGGDKKVNPWKKETWNMTAQGKLYKDNKPEAIRLAKEAGVELK